MEKKLYRDMDNKMLCGVCAGVGEYFKMDVSTVRLLLVLFVILGGAGVLAYIIAALVIPEKPANTPDNSQNNTPNV